MLYSTGNYSLIEPGYPPPGMGPGGPMFRPPGPWNQQEVRVHDVSIYMLLRIVLVSYRYQYYLVIDFYMISIY